MEDFPAGERDGIQIEPRCGAGDPSTELTISNNVIEDTTQAGMIVDGVVGVTITGNTIARVPEYGLNLGASGTGSGAVTISWNPIRVAGIPTGTGALAIKLGPYPGSVRVPGKTIPT